MFVLALVGCTDVVFFPPDLWPMDTADTGASSTEDVEEPSGVKVVSASAGCDPLDEAWTFTARTDGWVGFGVIDVFRTADQQSEQHTLFIVASDPGGGWDELSSGPLLANVDSQFDCVADAATLSFVVRVRDGDGALLDCAVWGADPQGATARIRNLDPDVLALGGCHLVSASKEEG